MNTTHNSHYAATRNEICQNRPGQHDIYSMNFITQYNPALTFGETLPQLNTLLTVQINSTYGADALVLVQMSTESADNMHALLQPLTPADQTPCILAIVGSQYY